MRRQWMVWCMALCLAACGGGGGGGDDDDGGGDSGIVGESSGGSGDTGGTGDSGDTGGTGGTGGTATSWYQPGVGITWQWQLLGNVDTSVAAALYDIDLFDVDAAQIAALQAAGHRVICYFSAGSYEGWRPDASRFQAAELGKTLDGFADERWLDVGSANVAAIMKDRLDLAVQKGCDGVEPDNVDGWDNDTGFTLSRDTQLAFNRMLASESHARGLAVGLKNALGQIPDLVGDFDFAVNEQCFEFDECDALAPFIAAGKPVLGAEYLASYVNDVAARDAMCADARQRGFSTLVLPLDLDNSFRFSCL
ncbi:MAG: endo alpha-1,4 polygalactosaminidase [Rhodocyclaceae bacterium]|nr:endo alpha-1,4 polygalactosaminidase [Rhodocyclaceae bacterium]